jgi:hypothetical protein
LVYLIEKVSVTPRNRCVHDMRRNGTWRNEKLAPPEKNTLDGVGDFREPIFLGTTHFLPRSMSGSILSPVSGVPAAAGGARRLHCLLYIPE